MLITLGFEFKLISSKLEWCIKGTGFTNQVGRTVCGITTTILSSSVGFEFKLISSSLKRLAPKGFWIHKLCSSAHITYIRHILFKTSKKKNYSYALKTVIIITTVSFEKYRNDPYISLIWSPKPTSEWLNNFGFWVNTLVILILVNLVYWNPLRTKVKANVTVK
jgi:hypothetical protein